MDGQLPRVCVFAPAPLLTVTIETGTDPDGDRSDIHLPAGGQGVWIARMVQAMGVQVVVCTSFAGEPGRVLRGLVAAESVQVDGVECKGTNGAYVHDRRSGERREVAAMPATPLSRHDIDALYARTVAVGLDCDAVVLGGPSDAGASEPAMALIEGAMVEISGPQLEPVDGRGAGDSLTAAVTAALARGENVRHALALGAAAGALNVTRRGLATASAMRSNGCGATSSSTRSTKSGTTRRRRRPDARTDHQRRRHHQPGPARARPGGP